MGARGSSGSKGQKHQPISATPSTSDPPGPTPADQEMVNSLGIDLPKSPSSNSLESTDLPRSHSLSSTDLPRSHSNSLPPTDVFLHVYHVDPCTGYLNNAFLKSKDLGMYHCGIEVNGEEWSFGFFIDCWNDPTLSGLQRCSPKNMIGYEYKETVNLGPTPLSDEEVEQVLDGVRDTWPACSYHIVHRNCMTFTQHIASLLQVPEPFPAWTKGAVDFSARNARMDAVVDVAWSWSKWWMDMRHGQGSDSRFRRFSNDVRTTLVNPTEVCSSICTQPSLSSEICVVPRASQRPAPQCE